MNDSVFLLLGTNLGDRSKNLSVARELISRKAGTIITTSAVYKTAAWGNTNQPEFYNQAIQLRTTSTPQETLTKLQRIESEMGRIRDEKWGSRIIDIDILLWEHSILTEDNLVVPHAQLQHRRFALLPLAEIAPDTIHPILNKSITQLLQECNDMLTVEPVL
jgi:2-amino-4-hydroxy-6-hydroxymethyldihydropteridine diphosphokinase